MPRKQQGKSIVNRLLPYTFLCTIGPSVTAATSLYIVRTLMCRYDAKRQGAADLPALSDGLCSSADVGALTASAMAALATLDGITSFFSTSYVQGLADKVGRRPLLVVLPVVATIATASMIVAYLVPNVNLSWVMLALNGLFVAASTKSVFIPTLCVADVASEKERTWFYSRLEAVSLLGPGSAYVISALTSRYIPVVLLPYYIALGTQIISSLYAWFFVAETLSEDKLADSDSESENSEEEDAEPEGTTEIIVEAIVEPVKPLKLILPHRNEDGAIQWRLFVITLSLLATTSGTVFIATASLLFLSDKFQFNPEGNGWVLAFFTFSRFLYLIIIFPYIQRFGRRVFKKRLAAAAGWESAPLIGDHGSNADAGHNDFDIIVVFVSVCFDSVALVLISTSKTYQQALAAFALLALGSADNPTYKSVFVSSVPEKQASQALAALDMVFNAARLLSPILLGSLYAVFAERGQPELLFLVAGGLCGLGAILLLPLIFARRGRRK